MTDKQIKWASKHGWYVGHGVNVENQVFIRVQRQGQAARDFTDIKELRLWAGY